MTTLVSYKLEDAIATIKMDDGKANVLSTLMIKELNEAFDRAEQDKAIVVLTGREGIFSGGFNLKEMQASQSQALALTSLGSKLARRILAFPTPVILLATGHTIAMGAFLALACDYRMVLEGDAKIGLNETLIGMPMHNFGIELASYRLPKHYFNRCVINAEIFSPSAAVNAGFFDKNVEADKVVETLKLVVDGFKQLDMIAFRGTKLRSRKAQFEILDQAIQDDLDPKKVHFV